jgi:cullin-associated NEDD8-dissociated protein 1
MTTAPYHISNLLEKMMSVDKDYRFMATNDLMSELQKDSIKLDDDSEWKVVQSVLRLLEDKNAEVQNLAVKCLGLLVRKVRDSHVSSIVSTLSSNIFSDKEGLRDVSGIGLKTIIAQFPYTSGNVAVNSSKSICDVFLTTIRSKQVDTYVLLEVLDILAELILKYSGHLLAFHDAMAKAFLPYLVDPHPLSVRKRTYIAICNLSINCSPSLFDTIISHLLSGLKEGVEAKAAFSLVNARTYIQTVTAITRHSGPRLTKHLQHIVPVVMFYSKIEKEDELRESCLQAFEALVSRCYKEITPYIPEIVALSLDLLCHDPNYDYGADDDEEGMEVDEPDEEDFEEDDEYSDDDDVSWKVRRASAKCLGVILGSRPEMLSTFYHEVSPAIIKRFKEREENVKTDIFAAYCSLLSTTKIVVATQQSGVPDSMETADNPLGLLATQVPGIVKALSKQLKERSLRTRQGCFALFTSLVSILPGALDTHMEVIIPGVLFSLTDKSSSHNLKMDALAFFNVLFTHHSREVFYPHISDIIPAVIACVGDSFYKIISEALAVLKKIVEVIKPLEGTQEGPPYPYEKHVREVYTATLSRLKATDIDQEVKEMAIICMSQVVSHFGPDLKDELPMCLPIFLDRLKNEITRLPAVKALNSIARSPNNIDLSLILNETIQLQSTFLRKNHRDLRLSTLVCLNSLMKVYGGVLAPDLVAMVMEGLPQLISDSDLHISLLVMSLLCTVLTSHRSDVINGIKGPIMTKVIDLVRSPLLQGNALNTVLQFFRVVVEQRIPDLGYDDLFKLLTACVYSPEERDLQSASHLVVHKQAFHTIAKCVGTISLSVSGKAHEVMVKFVGDVESGSASVSVKLLALFSIGEIGRHSDLSSHDNLHNVIIAAFGCLSEEVRTAASYALGSISAGNLRLYLPVILGEIQSRVKTQYLLLHSLKEVIACHYATPEGLAALKPYIPQIWPVLYSYFMSTEEGTRNVVAECVGKLTLLDPETLLPKLKENLTNPAAFVRSTVVTAFKYTITDQPQPIDSMLKTCIGEFLQTLGDPELNVRRVALVAFNSAAHNKHSLIVDLLDDLLPILYRETKVRQELIEEVEMGPFKQIKDGGLDTRKVAFECMYTLLDNSLDRLDIFEFLQHVEDGLKDHYDIKMLSFLLIVRLSRLRPTALLQRIDRLIEPLRATVQSKVKANAVKQEHEKQEELKRSALKAVVALQTIPDSDKSVALMDFIAQVKSSPETASLFDSVQQDNSSPSLSEAMDIK